MSGPLDDGLSVDGLLVDEVSVRYGSALALDRFTLEAGLGEIVAVVGPSGSGKSTLLRAVAGLEPLTGGKIVLGDRNLAGVPTHRRGLGLMFQDHGLFTHLTVADNIAYGLRTAGASKHDQHARVGELLELVGLSGFGPRKTSELSGGEAQRVALARALAPKPGLLMLDEPLGSLDRALRDQLTGDLRRLLTELGQTALHVTHDQAEAFALADRVAVVAEGRLVVVGTPAELWAEPGSRFVAEFLGHPNIWSVTVDREGSVSWTDHHLGTLAPAHPVRCSGPGRHLVVLPATAIRLDHDDPGHGDSRRDDPGHGDRGQDHRDASRAIGVDVIESVFRRGLYDVTAAVSSPGVAQPGEGSRSLVRFTSGLPVSPGQALTITVDIAALRPLSDD